jgi:hypothetical protein
VQAVGFKGTLLASFLSCLAAAPIALLFVRPVERATPTGRTDQAPESETAG